MPVKTLKSWKLTKRAEPFYPFGVRCIGVGSALAVATWSAHSIEMLMFRNFHDAIRRDEANYKIYSHPEADTDSVSDIAVGGQNSIVRMQSGTVKYFASRKKLSDVEYLQNVRALSSCHDGFTMVQLSDDGMSIFIRFHPDTFPHHESRGTHAYDISFERNACHSTWMDAHFVIKEVSMAHLTQNEKLARCLFPDSDDDLTRTERPLLIAIDQNLLSFRINASDMDDNSHIVHPLVSCSSTITNIWMTDQGDSIVLLLASGAIECLSACENEPKLRTQTIHLNAADEIVAADFGRDIFAYSDGQRVYYGTVRYNSGDGRFQYDATVERVCGVVALTVIHESDIILCISENNVFYVLSPPNADTNANGQWQTIDDDAQRSLHHFKQNVFELNETFRNLSKELLLQKSMCNATVLQSKYKSATDRCFQAKIKASRLLPKHSLAHSTIYISNNSALEPNSYFYRITFLPIVYDAEFQSPIWNLRLRWRNQCNPNKHTYHNVKLTTDIMLKPLNIIIHMKHETESIELPEVFMDINAPVQIGREFLYLKFAVHVEQANVRDIIEIHPTKPTIYLPKTNNSIPTIGQQTTNSKYLFYKIKLPTAIDYERIRGHADFVQYVCDECCDATNPTPSVWYVVVLAASLELTYHHDTHEFYLTSTDAGIMHTIKQLIYRIIIDCLPSNKTFHMPIAISNEYCVS